MLPYKEVISKLTINLSKDRPLESPWIIRTSKTSALRGQGGDMLSIASSYLKTSVLSSKSKRINIDNIIREHSEVMDRVKGIDDKLREIGGDDVSITKEEMIERVINNTHNPREDLEAISEDQEIKKENEKLRPTLPRPDALPDLSDLPKTNTSEEINLIQKMMKTPDTLNEIIRLSQMMIEAKIDFRILEFL